MSFLRKMFGPSKAEVWEQLSTEIGAQYVDSFWKGDKVQATHGVWTVTLDTYVVPAGKTYITYTRMRAPYENPSGFQFTIYRKGLFSNIGKWLGMQDIAIADPLFSEHFVVKANDETRVAALLADRKVRDLIEQQRDIHFTVRGDEGYFGATFPEGVDELVFHVVGVIKDAERLKLLFDLFAETLDRLCEIGSAAPGDPHVTL